MTLQIIVHEDLQSLPGSLDKTSDVKTPRKPRRSAKSSQATELSDVRYQQYCIQAKPTY